MKRAVLRIKRDRLDTADYYLQPSSIPRSVNVQSRASVMTDQDMLRHFQDAGLDIADFDMEPSHIRGARIIRKARDSTSSEDGETMGRLFEKAHLNISDFSVRLSPTGSGLTVIPAKSTSSPLIVAVTCFLSLPEDILFIIAEHCDPQDLLDLCLASKAMKEASVPHIYRHVDLSTHNRGLVICYGYEQPTDFAPYARFGPQEELSDSVKCTSIPVNMVRRQETFIKTLMNRKEYRKYVRVLIWTFLPPTGHWRSFSTDVAKPAFWDLMRCLENIRRFDLADLSKNWSTVSPRASLLRGQYFPHASSIRLLGVMEPVIAASILSTIDPTKLVRLTLDNVQCCGKAPYGTVFAPAPRLRPSTKAALPEYRKWWSVHSEFRLARPYERPVETSHWSLHGVEVLDPPQSGRQEY
ncbi:MAG: hypothetical protein ASARMPREDX12_008452 [Alectoria sarmentosa]|nr:MAG: hypothetical protein ASARMPREDX12_008452 [Alectoria sarmentosa]